MSRIICGRIGVIACSRIYLAMGTLPIRNKATWVQAVKKMEIKVKTLRNRRIRI